jgi:hypothetical protein
MLARQAKRGLNAKQETENGTSENDQKKNTKAGNLKIS